MIPLMETDLIARRARDGARRWGRHRRRYAALTRGDSWLVTLRRRAMLRKVQGYALAVGAGAVLTLAVLGLGYLAWTAWWIWRLWAVWR